MINNYKSRLSLLLLLVLLCLLALTTRDYVHRAQAAQPLAQVAETSAMDPADGGEAVARLTAAGEHGLGLTLETPAYTVDAQGAVTAPGLATVIGEAGLPALPYYSTLLVIPPEATVQVQVGQEQVRREAVPDVRPAPGADGLLPQEESNLRDLPLSAPPLTGVTRDPDPDVYARNALYPEAAYRLSEPMYYRDLRLVRLDLFPLRYNPVSQVMEHSAEMTVSVSFQGANLQQRRPAGGDATAYNAIARQILNYEQAEQWRSLPQTLAAEQTQLPVGRDAFKIEVDADGIYELTYEALEAAGMAVDSVNPDTLQMLHRGQPVAYEFIGDNDNEFEAGDSLRFYGWAFDGPRLEKQYVTSNIFWLFDGGEASRIETTPSAAGSPPATSYPAIVTREPENFYFATYTDRWDQFPNEPDAWYWDRYDETRTRFNSDPTIPYLVTKTVTVTAPADETGDAVVTAEFTSYVDTWSTNVQMTVNGAYSTNLSWSGNRNVNISTTVPNSALIDGPNEVQFRFDRTNSWVSVHLNRITVEYRRRFVSSDDQLIFEDAGGPHSYEVSGFSQGDPSALVWNISDRYQPQAVTDVTVAGSSPYTYEFGSAQTGATFIATHEGKVISDPPIEKYTVTNLEPAGGADWVAISYGDFIAEANRLAAHRSEAQFGGLQTHVVDVEDVINQYGYGLPIPEAIRGYLRHALQDWSTAPRYVLLVGDATLDPRQICDTDEVLPDTRMRCLWGKTMEKTYVVSDLLFVDRVQGHIPVDYTFGLLSGDDLIPEIAVGRIAAQSSGEVRNSVDKIMAYETLHLAPATWQKNVLFLADNPDTGGAFCAANQQIGSHVPASFVQNHLCLPDDPDNPTGPPLEDDVNAMRAAMYEAINSDGATFVNYRGHGAVEEWAHELASTSTDPEDNGHIGSWQNAGKPVIILSLDCLDGAFAYPNMPGLAESLLRLPDAGTAAHWSSTGLGWDFEHDILHYAFYDGLFAEGLTAIGDAIDYSKIVYEQTAYHDSQLLSFALQGDPAMQLMRPDLSLVKSASHIVVRPGASLSYELALRNDGLHPAQTTVVDTLPAGLNFVRATASTTATVSVKDNVVTVALEPALAWNDVATVHIETTIDEQAAGTALTNVAAASSPGLDVDPGDNQSQVTSTFYQDSIHLPLVRKE